MDGFLSRTDLLYISFTLNQQTFFFQNPKIPRLPTLFQALNIAVAAIAIWNMYRLEIIFRYAIVCMYVRVTKKLFARNLPIGICLDYVKRLLWIITTLVTLISSEIPISKFIYYFQWIWKSRKKLYWNWRIQLKTYELWM